MTSTDVVQSQVDAFNARDAASFAGHYSRDAQLLGSDGTVLMSGREAVESFYGALFDASPDLHVEIVSRIVSGDWVVDEELATGIGAEGMPSEMHALVVYHVGDGLIDRSQLLM